VKTLNGFSPAISIVTVKKFIQVIIFLIAAINNTNAQYRLSFYLMANNTNIVYKDNVYQNSAYRNIADQSERQSFYGNLKLTYASWHKSFGLTFNVLEKNKFTYSLAAGVLTMGHKEYVDGGKSENYPYGFAPFPAGDTLTIENKIYNYYFSAGPKVQYAISKNLSFELSVDYIITGNNSHKTIKTFRSVFTSVVTSNRNGIQTGKDIAYSDVNYKGAFTGIAGINTNISKRLKLHVLYLRTLTGVNRFPQLSYKKIQYTGIGIQLSYNFLRQPGSGDDNN
jgi:hypothetical protein